LSKIFTEDPEKMYELFFDIKGGKSVAWSQNEKEHDLLQAIKSFFAAQGFREDLDEIWEEQNYVTFVKEMLKIANTQPAKEKLIPYSEELAEKMRVAFRKAIISCDVYIMANHPNGKYVDKIDCFIKIIKDDIETIFAPYHGEKLYGNILEFAVLLEEYVASLTNDDFSSVLFSDYSIHRAELDADYVRLGVLFREICDGTLFPIKSAHIFSEDCDESVKELFLSNPDGEPVEILDDATQVPKRRVYRRKKSL